MNDNIDAAINGASQPVLALVQISGSERGAVFGIPADITTEEMAELAAWATGQVHGRLMAAKQEARKTSVTLASPRGPIRLHKV